MITVIGGSNRRLVFDRTNRFLSKYVPTSKITKRFYAVTGNVRLHAITRGLEYLRNRRLNKGLAFTRTERFAYGIYGLLPTRVKTLDEQVEVCKIQLNRCIQPLDKYMFLINLHARNEKLFFRLLTQNLEQLLPIVYTPTVAQAVQQFGVIYRPLRALFICIHDKGHVYEVIKNWPQPDVRATVVTDGERCLGLGDMGINSVCIAVGKMGLYTALGGAKPNVCMPVVLDAGTNNKTLLEDPLYLGLRQKRVSGKEYEEFVDEFLRAVVKRFGQKTVIQFEDFGNHNAFLFLDRYRNKYCTFNDDIQGTAGVVIAGLLTSKRIVGKKLKDHKFLFLGAGEAAIGTADLACKVMVDNEGERLEDARKKIWMFDINGLLAKGRPEGLDRRQSVYAADHAPCKNFEEVVKEFKPSVLIGVSTAGKTFTPAIIKAMASFNERPIIFALSNPTSQAECSAEDAIRHTGGRAIFASGSPFAPVEYEGKTYKTGLGNNAYIYPGIALGGIVGAVHHINEDVEVLAAQCVCDATTEEDLKRGSIYPPVSRIGEMSVTIASRMIEYGVKNNMSYVYPEPADKKAYISQFMFCFDYTDRTAQTWSYPKPPPIKLKPVLPF